MSNTVDRIEPQVTTRFAAYTVRSRSGPHVTMQAGVVHADRFWTTTSGGSLKARSISTHRTGSMVVEHDGRARVLAGRTSALRPFRPLDALKDPFAPLRSPGAVLRLGLGQVEQLIGYFEAGTSVPPDWLPHRRVLLVTRIDRSLTLDGLDVVGRTGSWRRTGDGRELGIEPCRPQDLPQDTLPPSHRDVVRLDARAHVGFETDDGPVSLPATWRGENRFEVSAPALAAIGADLPGRAAAVFDDSVSRRPDEKLGAMFRGHATLAEVDGSRATVLVETERITMWDGFEASTVPVR
jgi:hypothetical protein